MSLSFKDSLNKSNTLAAASKKLVATTMLVDDISVDSPAVMMLNETSVMTTDEPFYDGRAYDGWMKPDNASLYDYYDNEYSDDSFSVVDKNKNITLSSEQINLTQEKNSQYIPFEIARYYDGFDLTTTGLSIYWVNEKGHGSETTPVDVYYNSEKIRFAWLIDDDVTALAGKIKFEIHASGTNSKGYSYLWKTKSNDGLNVLQALEIKGYIEPDESWQNSFVEKLATHSRVAENAKNEAVAAAQQAQQLVSDLQNGISEEVQSVIGDNYYTKLEVDTAIADAQVDLTGYATEDFVTNSIGEGLENYALKSYVDDAVASVDVTEQLKDYAKSTDVNQQIEAINDNLTDNYHNKTDVAQLIDTTISNKGYATTGYVDQAIADADISGKLEGYYTKEETYSKTEVDEALENVTVDLTGYATETYVDNKIAPISSSVSTNTSSISSLNKTVGELQSAVNAMDSSPRLTYDIVYNDTEDENVGGNVLVLYEIENENKENETKTVKAKYTIVGGGGGSSSSTDLKIYFDKDQDGANITQYIYTVEDVEKNKAFVYYDFYGTDSVGDSVSSANAKWEIRRGTSGPWTTIATGTVYPGADIEFNVSKYLSVGSYQLKLSVSDDAGGFASKTWTIQQIDFKIKSDFNDKIPYDIAPVRFTYEPSGNISKDIYFILDGKEIGKVTTQVSGLTEEYNIPAQAHGAHLLEVYMVATINGNTIESNHIMKDIMWRDSASSLPIIATTYQNFTAKQYDATNIEYTVYDPSTANPTVEIAVNNVVVSTPTLDKATNVYSFKTDVVGEHTITITCGDTVKTLIANITKLDIDVKPVTAGLVFDFNPSGKSNNGVDRNWSYEGVSMTVSDNFDWVNGGYQYDENGDQYFCVKAGTTAIINHNLFADDAKVNGKEFKVVFKTTNIKKRDTTFISCMNTGIGLDMKVESANIYSSNGSLYSPYCEEDIIEFEFNINKNTDIPMVLTYEDGVGNRPMIYTSDSSFWQATPQPITIGSDDCDVHIYRMKAYSNSLTDSNILANFIADARNADEMVNRYNRNQIYDENNLLDPEVLAEKCPDLRIIMIDAPWFTNDKDNKVDDTTIRMIYKNGDAILDNWTCTGARHSGQGTSSNEYGYAGRNIDLIMDTDTSLFTLGDNTTTSKTITLTRGSVPTDYLNVKVNIASSENQNNAQMAKRYNDYNPFIRSAKFNDPKVKDTMEFYNCVIFVKERDGEGTGDVSNHREFLDHNYHFYAIGNVGDSKKTDDTRVNDKNDPKECVIEITDYNVALAEFPTGNPDGLCAPEDWKVGNKAYDDLYAEYKYKDGKFKSFGNGSYEFRYEKKGITEEQRQANIDAWRDAYRFIVTSTDEEFHSRLKEYFVIDSALYFYLFTERYLMCDNRAKNSFWHYGKVYITEAEAAVLGDAAGGLVVDDTQAVINDGYRWDLSFGYDFDKDYVEVKLSLKYGENPMGRTTPSNYIFTLICRLIFLSLFFYVKRMVL